MRSEIVEEKLDKEWLALLIVASKLGITPEEIRIFLKTSTVNQSFS